MPSLNLPTPNKTPGDGAPADDINLVIEAINTLNSAVDNIPAGPQGPQGEPGTPGAPGAAATITVASTTTTEPGANAQVIQSGTAQNAQLAFYIPRGEQGPTGPQGPQGAIGPAGATGATGATGAGVKPGGLEGYVLAKASNADYDTVWIAGGEAPPVTSVDTRTGAVTLGDLYDTAGSAAAAQSAAESYADGVASVAQSAAESYADGLAVNYDPAGSAASAQAAAESYADGLAVNYDPAGSAASAQAAAEAYADGLAVNYDPAGSAASAQAAAEAYADGLAVNYDPAGSASAVAGDLSTHELATTSVHGISDTSNLVYTDDSRLSDARTPTAHATSHESGGTDELELAPGQITGTAIVETIVDAKGDLIVGTGSDTVSRLAVSVTDGYVLTADSNESTGLKWAVAAAPVDPPIPVAFFLGGM